MDMLTRFMRYDGSVDAVFTHRTQPDTNSGTVWRFIMDGNKTLVVIPYQSPLAPAKAMHSVPKRIDSIFRDLEWTVHYVAQKNVNNDLRNWESEIDEATNAELQKWVSAQKLPDTAKYNKAKTKAHKARDEEWIKNGLAKRIKETGLLSYDVDTPTSDQIDQWRAEGLRREQMEQKAAEYRQTIVKKRQEISDQAFAILKIISDSEAYMKEQKRIAKHRAQIEAKHRKRIEAEKAKRAAEIEAEALTELGRTLSAYGIKNFDKAKLKTLYEFIQEDVCQGNCMNPVIRDVTLRRVLAKVEELTGENIAERVFFAYSSGMKSHVDVWAKETAEAEKIEETEARQRILERVHFVAVFEDNIIVPIQVIIRCVHDEKDEELFRLVAPNEAARAEIKIEVEKCRIKLQASQATIPRTLQPVSDFDPAEWAWQSTILDKCKISRRHFKKIRHLIPSKKITGKKWPYFHLPTAKKVLDSG